MSTFILGVGQEVAFPMGGKLAKAVVRQRQKFDDGEAPKYKLELIGVEGANGKALWVRETDAGERVLSKDGSKCKYKMQIVKPGPGGPGGKVLVVLADVRGPMEESSLDEDSVEEAGGSSAGVVS